MDSNARFSQPAQYHEISLYVHVPFCRRICPYCTFYHQPWDPSAEAEYIEAVVREIRTELAADGGKTRLRTVYLGGGSPAVLSRKSLGRLIESYAPFLAEPVDSVEQTIELNPEEVTEDLLEFLAGRGINRLSLGIQSFEENTQRWLGRCEPAVNNRAIKLAGSRFENINADLLAGVPDRTGGRLAGSLERLLAAAPKHVSVYCLEVGPDGPARVRNFLRGVDQDRSAAQYLEACDVLQRSGYIHYEVSNFARPGYESAHNWVYWSGGEYLGVGPAAHSFMAGRRCHNEPSLTAWLKSLTAGEPSGKIIDTRRSGQLETERLMLALRTVRGLPLEGLGTGPEIIRDLVAGGLARQSGGRLVLTDRGFLVMDEIVLRLMAGPGG